jgi:hypothetical protein
MESVAVRINRGIIGWISTRLSVDNGSWNSKVHVLSIMPLKKILNDSNGQMQIAITNETGQFSERFTCSSVGGVSYGLFAFFSSSGFDLGDGKFFVL